MALDRQHTIAVVGLTLGLLSSIFVIGVAVVSGHVVPESLPTLAGACSGGLAGFLYQTPKGS